MILAVSSPSWLFLTVPPLNMRARKWGCIVLFVSLTTLRVSIMVNGSSSSQHRLVPWGSNVCRESDHYSDLHDAGLFIYHKRGCRRPAANHHSVQITILSPFKGDGIVGFNFQKFNQTNLYYSPLIKWTVWHHMSSGHNLCDSRKRECTGSNTFLLFFKRKGLLG